MDTVQGIARTKARGEHTRDCQVDGSLTQNRLNRGVSERTWWDAWKSFECSGLRMLRMFLVLWGSPQVVVHRMRVF